MISEQEIKANVARNLAARNAEREDLISYISDEYKGLHGIRPHWMPFREMTLAELKAEARKLSDEIEADLRREREDRRIAREKIAQAYHRTEWTIGDLIS